MMDFLFQPAPHNQCSPVTLQRQHNTFKAKNNFCFPLCLRKHVWKPKTLLFQMTSPAAHTCISCSTGCLVQSIQHHTGRKAWKQQLIESLGQPRHSPSLRTFKMFESLPWISHDSREENLNVMRTKGGASPDMHALCVSLEGFHLRTSHLNRGGWASKGVGPIWLLGGFISH